MAEGARPDLAQHEGRDTAVTQDGRAGIVPELQAENVH